MVNEIVVGATRKSLQVQLLDQTTGDPLVFGSTPTVTLEGTSLDLPGVAISASGTITDTGNAICTWTSAGSLITSENLGGKSSAVYTCRVKIHDGGGYDWTPSFVLTFSAAPAVA